MLARLLLVVGAGACARDARPPAARPDPQNVPDLAGELAKQPVSEGVSPISPPASTVIDPGDDNPQPIREAVALLEPTRGNRVRGTVRLRETSDGLEVFAAV